MKRLLLLACCIFSVSAMAQTTEVKAQRSSKQIQTEIKVNELEAKTLQPNKVAPKAEGQTRTSSKKAAVNANKNAATPVRKEKVVKTESPKK